MIGDDVEVLVLSFDNRSVKVGIRAPRHVPVVRKELREVAEYNATALKMPAPDRLSDALVEAQEAILRRSQPVAPASGAQRD